MTPVIFILCYFILQLLPHVINPHCWYPLLQTCENLTKKGITSASCIFSFFIFLLKYVTCSCSNLFMIAWIFWRMFYGTFPEVYGSARAGAVREESSVTEVARYLLVSYEFPALSDFACWIMHPVVMEATEMWQKVSWVQSAAYTGMHYFSYPFHFSVWR